MSPSAQAPSATARVQPSVPTAAATDAVRVQALLATASDAVVTTWRQDDGYQLTPAVVAPVVQQVTQRVLEALDRPHVAASDLPPWVNAQALIGRLRSAYLEAAMAGPSPSLAMTLQVMVAFDRVQRAIDDDCTQRFVGRLSGPDAARLVVELAHDMRSAMGSILFLSETVKGGASGPVTATQQRQLGLIYSAALGLSGIINDVVDLARGATRLLDQPPVAFQLSEVVSSLLAVVRPTAEEKGLELAVSLPDVGTRVGQPAVLGRVLLNLVSNALKFTESGTVRLDIERGEGTNLVFRVSDTGRGMPPAVLANLFDAFRARGGVGDEYFSGAGLGLAMCRTLLTRMGSELDVVSLEGHGTTFAFTLRMPFATLI